MQRQLSGGSSEAGSDEGTKEKVKKKKKKHKKDKEENESDVSMRVDRVSIIACLVNDYTSCTTIRHASHVHCGETPTGFV